MRIFEPSPPFLRVFHLRDTRGTRYHPTFRLENIEANYKPLWEREHRFIALRYNGGGVEIDRESEPVFKRRTGPRNVYIYIYISPLIL